jgi:hypothetical protein
MNKKNYDEEELEIIYKRAKLSMICIFILIVTLIITALIIKL